MVHVLRFTETRPPLPYRAHFLTNVGDDLMHNGILNIILHNMWPGQHLLHAGLWHRYLELLVWGAATRTAGALDSDSGLPFCVTHFQERGEHAPPERTHTHTQHLETALHNHGVSKQTMQNTGEDFTGWCGRGLDAWLVTFSAVMILHGQNHWELSVRRGQTGSCFNWAQLRIFIPSRPLVN